MSMTEWYYARGQQQSGPVSSVELKRLALAGELQPEDLVWREGLTEWAPARSVRGLFEEPAPPAVLPPEPVLQPAMTTPSGTAATITAASETTASETTASETVASETRPVPKAAAPAPHPPAAGHVFDIFLDSLRFDFNARFVDTTARFFRLCGLYGLWIGMLVTAIFSVLAAMQQNIVHLLVGALWLGVLAALQYIAGKFCDALDRLNRTTRGTLNSTALPDCVAILSLMTGLVILFGSVPVAVSLAMYPAILWGMVGFVICGYLAFAALNPSTLGISVASDEMPASAEALNVVTFLLKAKLRAVPVAFGAGVMAGALMMGYACYEALANPEHVLAAERTAALARSTLIFSAALPFAAYLVALFYFLLLDLCRALLILPGKPQ
jgi:hypothetical protein